MLPRTVSIATCLLIASCTATNAAAQDEVIVVQANMAQKEIERILDLDNLEVELLPAREVAAAMSAIHKGRAPRDFWAAYQAHAKAWQRYAGASQAALMSNDTMADRESAVRKAEAKLAIETTFDEVERIARRYGARIPIPRTRTVASY